ncbi:hypothetical protein Tco_1346564 [Tanacetum coccineum]
MWTGLVLVYRGPSETKDTKIAALRLKFNDFKALEGEKVNGTFTRLKCLLSDLENNGVSIPQAKFNATPVNSLPRKWVSMNQTQRANNSIKNDTLAALYGKYNYEEGPIDQIHDDSNVEEDTKSSNKFLADLNAEFHDKALLSNQKRYYKRSGRVGSTKKPIDKTKETCFTCGKLGDEIIPLKDEGVTKVKAFMAIAEEEPFIRKNDARSVPGNIVRALGGRGKKRDTISLKKVLFSKTIKSPSETIPEITSDSESECGNLEPLPSILKLIGS